MGQNKTFCRADFLINDYFLKKNDFLHPHEPKSYKIALKCLCFCFKKLKKNRFFYFSQNASRCVLMTLNRFLSIPHTSKHLLEARKHPRTTSKIFSENRFSDTKIHFSRLRAPRASKSAFVSPTQND